MQHQRRKEKIVLKTPKKAAVKLIGAVAATSTLAGMTAYFTTRMLVKTALDRKEPKIMEKAGNRISGALVDEEILKRIHAAGQKLEATETREVSVIADDGVGLIGHWYPCANPKRIIIAVHGWRNTWYGTFGMVADSMHENDSSILFIEQRGQNNSGGDYMGFGVTERYDCLRWIHWVVENQSDTLPIYLCGISMGATTVLMAAGLGLPQNVHGIIADCGFTSPDEIWKHIATNNLHLVYHLRRAIAEKIYQRKIEANEFRCSTIDAMHTATTPVLFIHGTEDHFVPVEMTYRNYMACAGPKQLLIVPGADHGMSYLAEPERYETEVKNFWKEFD